MPSDNNNRSLAQRMAELERRVAAVNTGNVVQAEHIEALESALRHAQKRIEKLERRTQVRSE
jgi:uncharacterized coiled-coil protein SlyX